MVKLNESDKSGESDEALDKLKVQLGTINSSSHKNDRQAILMCIECLAVLLNHIIRREERSKAFMRAANERLELKGPLS